MAAEAELMERHGASWSMDLGMMMVGQPLIRSAQILIDRGGLPITPEQGVDAMLDAVGAAIHRDGVPWLPGIPELIARMRGADVPCALVTSTYARVSREVVDAAGRLPGGGFDLLVAGDDVEHPKPAPDPYLVAARRLGIDIADCLVLEDSTAGVDSGLAAGAHVVAIPCILPVAARPGLSRVASAEELDEDTVARIMAGETVDTLAP